MVKSFLKYGKIKFAIQKSGKDYFEFKNESIAEKYIDISSESPITKFVKGSFDYANSLSDEPFGKRNLLYFSVGYNEDYFTLLMCCLRSIQANAKNPNFDILIIHDGLDESQIESCFDLNIKFHFIAEAFDGVEASVNKLKIFDFKEINQYNKVLFLDADVIVDCDLSKVFDLNLQANKIYSYIHDCCKYAVHNTKYHTIQKYSKQEIDIFEQRKIRPFNAGQFMFLNSQSMRVHFENVNHLFKIWKDSYFFEQSFLNFYFNLNLASDTFLFDSLFYIYYIGNERMENQELQKNKIVHYAGSPCDGSTKLQFVEENFESYL